MTDSFPFVDDVSTIRSIKAAEANIIGVPVLEHDNTLCPRTSSIGRIPSEHYLR